MHNTNSILYILPDAYCFGSVHSSQFIYLSLLFTANNADGTAL